MDIIDYLKQEETICVFDIDGVLAPYEFGKTLKHRCTDEEWEEYIKSHPYKIPIPVMQNFIKNKDTKNIYVCSVAEDFERPEKIDFCFTEYGIPEDHVFFVSDKKNKIKILKAIQNKRHCEERKIAMIEDTTETLDQIFNESDFTTVHVSSFFKREGNM